MAPLPILQQQALINSQGVENTGLASTANIFAVLTFATAVLVSCQLSLVSARGLLDSVVRLKVKVDLLYELKLPLSVDGTTNQGNQSQTGAFAGVSVAATTTGDDDTERIDVVATKGTDTFSPRRDKLALSFTGPFFWVIKMGDRKAREKLEKIQTDYNDFMVIWDGIVKTDLNALPSRIVNTETFLAHFQDIVVKEFGDMRTMITAIKSCERHQDGSIEPPHLELPIPSLPEPDPIIEPVPDPLPKPEIMIDGWATEVEKAKSKPGGLAKPENPQTQETIEIYRETNTPPPSKQERAALKMDQERIDARKAVLERKDVGQDIEMQAMDGAEAPQQ